MTESDLEIFLHTKGERPKVLAAQPGHTLHEVLALAGVLREGDEEAFVFVGEWDEARGCDPDAENGEDAHEPVDIKLTLAVLELHRHRHVHKHHCKRIAVEVNFGGKSAKHKFSPATTIGTVTAWAIKRRKFKIDPAAGAEYVLQIHGTTTQPRTDEHLGELVTNECALVFDLITEVTPQGHHEEA